MRLMTNRHHLNHPDAWSWIRAFYFEPCKDSLILDGVWPAVTPTCGCSHVRRAYFQRDWVGGPNILVGLRPCCEVTRPSETASRIEQYVARNPSRSSLSATEHARIAESLIRHERNGQAGVLQPNNSVFVGQNEPEGPLVQHPPIKEAYRNYLCDSSMFCVDWLREIRVGALDRCDLAVHLMIALLWLTDRAYLRSHVSLMSHAIGFFSIDRDGSIRRKFAGRYEGVAGDATRRVLLADVAALERDEAVVSGMVEFVALLRNCLTDFYSSTKSKRYQPEPMTGQLDASPAWRSWQITISLLYRTLNQLGLTPLERFLACYMISRACEDIYGAKALELKEILNRGPEGAESILTFFHQYA
ncbi:MAG TPA: hypothetical protein VKY85_14535 [Candidatus Angelobacter sp.]|nr:hypothetical protein [Candidatus Angelobacter sp.]